MRGLEVYLVALGVELRGLFPILERLEPEIGVLLDEDLLARRVGGSGGLEIFIRDIIRALGVGARGGVVDLRLGTGGDDLDLLGGVVGVALRRGGGLLGGELAGDVELLGLYGVDALTADVRSLYLEVVGVVGASGYGVGLIRIANVALWRAFVPGEERSHAILADHELVPLALGEGSPGTAEIFRCVDLTGSLTIVLGYEGVGAVGMGDLVLLADLQIVYANAHPAKGHLVPGPHLFAAAKGGLGGEYKLGLAAITGRHRGIACEPEGLAGEVVGEGHGLVGIRHLEGLQAHLILRVETEVELYPVGVLEPVRVAGLGVHRTDLRQSFRGRFLRLRRTCKRRRQGREHYEHGEQGQHGPGPRSRS